MDELTTFYKIVIAILGFIISVGGATAVISRWGTPFRTLKAQVSNKADKSDLEALRQEVKTLQGYQSDDHKELRKIETGTEKICKCVLAITDHELTGNSIDKLRKAKDEMQDFLIEK